MQSSRLCAALLLLATTSLFADQIILKNGDRITGTVVSKDGANLVIQSDLFGVVTTAWDKVESVQGTAPVYVTSKEGKTTECTVSVAKGVLEVGGQKLPAADITAIRNAEEQKAFERLQAPGWGQLWAGTGTVGWAGSAGNAKTLTFTSGVKATRATSHDKTTVYFNSIKASALISGKSAGTAEAVRGGLGYDHNFSPRLFVSTFNDYEYDKFQNLDLRFVAGGGFGFHARNTKRMKLDVIGGGDFNHSAFATFTRKSAEAYFGNDYEFKLNSATTMFQSARMFNDLTNTGQYRVNFDSGASVKISKWLNWNLSISDRYLNTPAPGRKSNDILYTTGFGLSFAR